MSRPRDSQPEPNQQAGGAQASPSPLAGKEARLEPSTSAGHGTPNEARPDAEQELQRALVENMREERDGFFQLSLDMLCMAGFDGYFKRLNPAWERTLGWSIEEMLARPSIEFVHPDDRAKTLAERGKLKGGGTTLAFENRYLCKGGGSRILSWRSVSSLQSQTVFASVRDVTDARQAEAEQKRATEERERLLEELHLRRQDEHLRLLAEAIPQLVWTATPDGNVDYYNQRWLDYTGMTLQQTAGWGWTALVHPGDVQGCIDRWADSLRTGDHFEVEHRLRYGADQSYRWHLGRARPVKDTDGRIVRWFGTFTDIDDQRRAQDALREHQQQLELRVRERTLQLSLSNQALEQSLREKEVLLKEVHHRVKNNLQVVLSILRLHAGQLSDPLALAAFQDSQDRVRSIALLHEQLYQQKNLASVSAESYARALIETLLRANAHHAVSLSIEAEGITLPMDAAVPFGLVLNELVMNALKHGGVGSEPRSSLRVQILARGEELELVISDSGPGFPAGFDPALCRSLGMHLVLALSEQLDGSVRFSSPGGAEARLRFPRPVEREG